MEAGRTEAEAKAGGEEGDETNLPMRGERGMGCCYGYGSSLIRAGGIKFNLLLRIKLLLPGLRL
jgi:hypothetical protein